MKKLAKRLSLASLLSIALTLFQPVAFAPAATASESSALLSGSWRIYSDGEDVSISWELGEAADTTLVVDGYVALRGSRSGHLFLKDAAAESETLDVSLTATKPVDKATAQTLAQKDQTTTEQVYERYVHLTTSRIPFDLRSGENYSDSATAATGQPAISILRYQTFIPWEYVDQEPLLPRLGCTPNPFKTYAFNGNNRGFNPLSSSFKTRMDTWIYWEQGGALASNVSVGLTERYEKVGTSYIFEDSKRASDSSMQIIPITRSNTTAAFKMSQNVLNPFCLELGNQGIQFEFDVQVWRSGKYLLDGWAIRVPSHEAYLKESDSPAWFPILRSGFDNFGCLVPGNINLPWLNCKNEYSLRNQKD
jgi:hypothetical protein